MNEYLQAVGKTNVYALGDCASVEDNPTPCTAQVHDGYLTHNNLVASVQAVSSSLSCVFLLLSCGVKFIM